MNQQYNYQQNYQRQRSLWSRIWENEHGEVVIWQTPNIPLVAWVVLTILSLLVSGRLADVFSWLGSTALIIWSLLEIFRGASYFRRALGLVVLACAIVLMIKSI